MTSTVNVPPPGSIRVLDGGQGWVGLIYHMGDESTITNAARVSFGKMKSEFDDKDVGLLSYLIKNKHMTPLEHVTFTFIVHCPLFVRGQWHRHRTWSFNEISRRYTEVGIDTYKPAVYRLQSTDNKQCSTDGIAVDNDRLVDIVQLCANECLATYGKLLDAGVCREQARMVLPQSLMTTFWGTVDLRNLLHFLELRDDGYAQREIREYAVAIKRLIRPLVPHVIDIFDKNKTVERR